jgi:hypothetical protein
MMLWLLEQAVRDCVLPLGWQRQDSTLHAYRNSFLLEVIPLLLREGSMPRLGSE